MHETDNAAPGRRVLLAVGVACVAVGGLLGAFVGANGGGVVAEFSVLGLVAIPVAPVPMALFGMAVVAVFMGALYAAVELASRLEAGTTDERTDGGTDE